LGKVVKQNNTDLSDLENGIYIINADGHTEKVIVKK
jgi:hypothetical protein